VGKGAGDVSPASSVAMKQSAAIQGEQRIQQLSQAFGRFFRQTIEHICPHELGSELDPLTTSAQNKLHDALRHSNESESLYRQAVAAALTTVRAARQQRAEQSVEWVELNDEKLSADPQQYAQTVQESLAKLPDNRRRAVSLHLAGMTNVEIAELLGCGERKARQQVEQGLQAFRKTLRAAGIDYESD
jgi:DNA-directed RNA polymerase specialized sigma subunit